MVCSVFSLDDVFKIGRYIPYSWSRRPRWNLITSAWSSTQKSINSSILDSRLHLSTVAAAFVS
jgi:hypothetical protein